MEASVITVTDKSYVEEVKQFLGYKPGNCEWHIERCVTVDFQRNANA